MAYFDIIGWTKSCNDKNEYARVTDVAQRLGQLPNNFRNELKQQLLETPGITVDPAHQKMEVVTFSDNIAVSTSIETDHDTFFKFISFVCRELLTLGFLTRGGVAAGELRHVENVIFGPALIEAVSLEKEAIYPRICAVTA